MSKAKLRENRESNFSYVGGERMYFMTKEAVPVQKKKDRERE
jgi:hypothetical protein